MSGPGRQSPGQGEVLEDARSIGGGLHAEPGGGWDLLARGGNGAVIDGGGGGAGCPLGGGGLHAEPGGGWDLLAGGGNGSIIDVEGGAAWSPFEPDAMPTRQIVGGVDGVACRSEPVAHDPVRGQVGGDRIDLQGQHERFG